MVLRRSSFCVSYSEPHQALDLLLLSSPPPALSAIDKTASYLTAARNHKGSYPGKSRTGGRECPLAPTTHHPPSTNQTTDMHENGSTPASTFGKGRSGLETSSLDCSARDASQVVSSGVSPLLEAEVKGEVGTSEGGSRDHCLDQGDGKQQSTLGSGTDPRRIAQAGYSRLQTNHPEVHAVCAYASIKRAKLGDFPPQSCQRNLGM